MARKAPKEVAVSQKYETVCTWRLHRIFNFREGQAKRRLVSNRRHSNIHAIGNGNSSRPDVLTIIDEKYPHIDVSSKKTRDYGCKSISCVKNYQVADQGNEATKMVVAQKFINGKYLCEDGAGSQPNQFFDALQILYSNKELFLKLLQDPNSLLVKQIYDLQNSQMKEQYQAWQKNLTRSAAESRWNNALKSNTRQCENPCKYDRNNLSCDPQSSNKIVLLNPGPTKVQNVEDIGCHFPSLHSHRFSHNAQTVKPSHFPFSHIKRKLRHAMGIRRKEQQWRTIDGVLHKCPCGCQGLENGDRVIGLESVGRNSPSSDLSAFVKGGKVSLDLKKRDKMIKIKDFKLCIGQEAGSVRESCGRNMSRTLASPHQNLQNLHVEARKSLSEILNSRIEERKRWTNTQGRTFPLPEFESLPGSLGKYWENMVLGNKSWLQNEEEDSCFSSLGQNTNELPGAIVKTVSNQLQCFGTNIRNSSPQADYGIPRGHEKLIKSSYDLHTRENRHMDVTSEQDSRHKDSPTQSFDMDITTEGIGSFMDSPPEILVLNSPQVASSSPSSCQSVEDPVNMRNRVENGIESVLEKFIWEEVTNPPSTISQPAELPVQAMHDKFEEHRFGDLIRSSLDPINNLITSMDMSDYVREVLQAFSLKWDELVMQSGSPDQLLDPSTFNELKGFTNTNQLSGSKILFDCVKEVLVEIYENFWRFPNVQSYVVKKIMVNEVTELINLHHLQHPSARTLEQLAEKDLARRGSWLNGQVNTEDIAIEVEEDVLEKLMLEMVSEMDIRSVIHRYI